MKVISRDAVLRLLDENGVVFRKTIEELPTFDISFEYAGWSDKCKDCQEWDCDWCEARVGYDD